MLRPPAVPTKRMSTPRMTPVMAKMLKVNPPVNVKPDLALHFVTDIPRSMWRLASNPVYIVTCLGACMELIIVSGFVVFLPKYLETQFSLGKSQASVFTGKFPTQ